MQQICVIGLGLFGTELAGALSRFGCEVLALDRDQEKVNQIRDKVLAAVTVDVRDRQALEEVIPPQLDAAVVSLGESVEASIMCTLHLKNMKVTNIITKAVSSEHGQILQAVGAHEVIFPEQAMALRTARGLVNPNLLEFLPLPGDYRVERIPAASAFVGKSLKDLDLRNKYGIMVLAVEQEGRQEDSIFLPPADYTVKPKDRLLIVGKGEDLAALD